MQTTNEQNWQAKYNKNGILLLFWTKKKENGILCFIFDFLVNGAHYHCRFIFTLPPFASCPFYAFGMGEFADGWFDCTTEIDN